LKRNLNDSEQLFNHAQSAYWLGDIAYKEGKLRKAEGFFQLYLKLAIDLENHDPNNSRSQIEIISASTNLGILRSELGNHRKAIQIYSKLIPIYERLVSQQPNNLRYQEDFENLYGWLADAAQNLGEIDSALSFRKSQESISVKLRELRPNNQKYRYNLLTNVLATSRLQRRLGNLSSQQTKITEDAHADALSLHAFEPINSDWAMLVLRFKYELLFSYQSFNAHTEANKVFADIKLFEDCYHNLSVVYQDELSNLKDLYMSETASFRSLKFTR